MRSLKTAIIHRGITGIVFWYVLFAGAWILLSDSLLAALVQDPAIITRLSIYKGWLFVLVTASLLYGLIFRLARRLEKEHELLLASERERLRLETRMQQAQKLESLGVLAGGIAHDFNNLLTVILGNVNLAQADSPEDSPARNSLREIQNASRRAAELCRQLLAYAGRGRFLIEPVNLSDLVRELTELLRVSMSKKIELRLDLPSDIPAVEADGSQLRQVAMNLVINAAEAIGKPGGAITITTGAMQCDEAYLRSNCMEESPPPGLFVFLKVADTGCGMDAQTVSKIFEPFFTTKYTGRGLGLAALLGIVRGHKGCIKIQSQPGHGTVFEVLFPASSKAIAKPEPRKNPEKWSAGGAVLFVDDEEALLGMGKQMIELCGFSAFTASDSQEAIRLFQEHSSEIVCILMDLDMPRMDGVAMFRELRRIRPDVKVILTSGYSGQEISERFDGLALAGFIEKPFDLASIGDKLREVLTKD
jgi:signal transduction histidine kinase/CheY-like chemotaxis protein